MHLEDNWAKKTKWLTQALILSGTLNIALIATFAYFSLKEKQSTFVLERPLKPASLDKAPTNIDLLRSYAVLPYQELLLRLENRDLVEQGFSKRDLALSCLYAFHHFHVSRALGGIPLQKRDVSFTNPYAQETAVVPLFSGLSDIHFLALINYAKTEKWPLTAQGLFYELKRNTDLHDPSLKEAFVLTAEYLSIETLFAKSGIALPQEELIALLKEGSWETLNQLYEQQKLALDLSADKRRSLLLSYVQQRSLKGAELLIKYDAEFMQKRASDAEVLTLLDLCTTHSLELELLAKELLLSARIEAVWKKAAGLLYAFAGVPMQEPYDHALAVRRFCPDKITLHQVVSAPSKAMSIANTPSKKKLHTVEPGENLWKIAKKYKVSIEAIMRCNHLDSDKVRPGRQLEIPQGPAA